MISAIYDYLLLWGESLLREDRNQNIFLSVYNLISQPSRCREYNKECGIQFLLRPRVSPHRSQLRSLPSNNTPVGSMLRRKHRHHSCEHKNPEPLPAYRMTRSFPLQEWRFGYLGRKEKCAKFLDILNRSEKICYKNATTWMPCDALLICALLFPESCVGKTRMFHATVELGGKYTRGQMVLDHMRSLDDNVKIIDFLSTKACKEIFEICADI